MEYTFTTGSGEITMVTGPGVKGGLIVRKALAAGPSPRRFTVIVGGGEPVYRPQPKLRLIPGGQKW